MYFHLFRTTMIEYKYNKSRIDLLSSSNWQKDIVIFGITLVFTKLVGSIDGHEFQSDSLDPMDEFDSTPTALIFWNKGKVNFVRNRNGDSEQVLRLTDVTEIEALRDPDTFYRRYEECFRKSRGEGEKEEAVIGTHPLLPDLPVPMGELFYECTLFLYSAFALFSMYTNLYKALWWVPKSHLNYYIKLHLIDPYVLSCVGLILGRRVTWCFLRNIPVFVAEEGESLPFYFQLLEWLIKLPMLGVVLSSFVINFIRVLTTHAWASLLWLFYPVAVVHVFLYYKEILSLFQRVGNLKNLVKRIIGYVEGEPALLDVNVKHACSLQAPRIREEAGILMSDAYQRLKQCTFSAFTVVYFALYVPCSFTPKTLFIDKWWMGELGVLVFLTSFCLYLNYLMPLQYCNLLHLTASHLGSWTQVEQQSVVATVPEWSSAQIYAEPAVVKLGNAYYRAVGHSVAADPTSSDHVRLYGMAKDPLRLLNSLCIFQGVLIAAVFFLLVHSTEWQHIFTLVVLVPANYVILFFLFKDKVILGRVYHPPEDSSSREN